MRKKIVTFNKMIKSINNLLVKICILIIRITSTTKINKKNIDNWAWNVLTFIFKMKSSIRHILHFYFHQILISYRYNYHNNINGNGDC